ncbi:MAG TPA: 2-oxo acid dehydrogenase subunit E2 [Ignavibacteria bacterium]|nr:2-oxo acid dehydrogenase subunit E2 [Ignavibacteria bacterium]
MAKEVVLPEISENIDSGDVTKVLVKIGDTIEVDQPVIEVETEKASFEVPSTVAGKVTEINVKEGDKIKVGSVIVKVEESGGGKSDEKSDEKSEKKSEDKKESKEDSKEEKSKPKEEDTDNEQSEEEKNIEEEEKDEADEDEIEEESKKEIKASEDKKSVKKEDKKEEKPKEESKEKSAPSKVVPASPSVRRLARELGVDLSDIQGSGGSGRITEDDVKKHIKTTMSSGGGGKVSPATAIKLPDFSKWGDIEIEKMSNVRKKTAETMLNSWNSVPQVTQFDKADITSLEEFRKKNADEVKKQGGNLTMTAILVKVITLALQKFPNFNTSIDLSNQTIINKKYYNIGIAVDTDRGLLVPVIKNTDSKGLTEISIELTQLAEKARSKKITLDEMDGGTFTISNLGGIGGTNFSPIVYSPQVAILGVSRASKEAVYVDDKFEPRLMLPLSLSYDHRIIDGADAARFLRWVCGSLENLFNLFL